MLGRMVSQLRNDKLPLKMIRERERGEIKIT